MEEIRSGAVLTQGVILVIVFAGAGGCVYALWRAMAHDESASEAALLGVLVTIALVLVGILAQLLPLEIGLTLGIIIAIYISARIGRAIK